MEILLLIGWIVGILLAIILTAITWVTRDKQMWEALPLFWLAMILTGYITGLAICGVMILFALNSRFEK